MLRAGIEWRHAVLLGRRVGTPQLSVRLRHRLLSRGLSPAVSAVWAERNCPEVPSISVSMISNLSRSMSGGGWLPSLLTNRANWSAYIPG